MEARILLFLHLFFQNRVIVKLCSDDCIFGFYKETNKKHFIRSLKTFELIYTKRKNILSYQEKQKHKKNKVKTC